MEWASRSRLSDSGKLGEFSTDLRNGLTSVSNLESVQELVRCAPNGLILSDKRQWGGEKYTGFDDEIATYAESHLEKVPVPDAWKMVAYSWDNSTTTALQTSPKCEHAAAYM